MIERTYPGVPPHLPDAETRQVYSLTSEAIRLATFRQSEETRDGKVAPFVLETQH